MLLTDLPLEITALADEGIPEEIEEEGNTFAENAAIKAGYYAKVSGLLTFADDSGLEVWALGGEPGVHSRRYAGPNASDPERLQLLLSKMAGIPWEQRQARFICAIAIAEPQGPMHLVEGTCHGIIAFEPRGSGGFGYDPVFYLPSHGKTLAELSLEEKNAVSHRGQAARKARALLLELLVAGPDQVV